MRWWWLRRRWRLSTAHRTGLFIGIFAATGFSFKAIFVKLGLAHGGDAITLLALRMAFALPAFLLMAWHARRGGIDRLLGLAMLGLLGYYLSSLFDFLGLQYISAGLERLILFVYPTLVLVFSALLFGERITRRAVAALAMCYAGIGLALSHDVRSDQGWDAVVTGSLWVFASAVTYAAYWMGSGRLVHRVGSLRLTAYATTFASLFCLGHFFLARPLTALIVPPAVYLDGLALALFSTVLPIWLQAEAIRRIGASTAALVATLGPVLTIFFAWAILDERLSAWQLAGTVLVIGGVSLAGSKRQRSDTAAKAGAASLASDAAK
jgi:drug/metabolite transporter (DMT)-like permease